MSGERTPKNAGASAMSARPWLCPERTCTPLLNLRDGDYRDITVPEPGHSFTCWGGMRQPLTFVYDGVEHTNDLNCCHYTPLKGLVRWQENEADWQVLASYYSMASRAAAEWRAAEQPPGQEETDPDIRDQQFFDAHSYYDDPGG